MSVDDVSYKVKLSGKFLQLNTNGIYSFGNVVKNVLKLFRMLFFNLNIWLLTGGFGRDENTKIRTNGYFERNFKGCISDITFNDWKVLATPRKFLSLSGRNINLCGVG